MIRLSIRRPVAITMAYLTVALLGVAAWRNIPIELLPNAQLPQLSVHASWRGASPEVTEAFLTSPMEAAIQQVRGVQKVTSTSSQQNGSGLADIQIEFAQNTDMQFAHLDLSERLAALQDQLPPGVLGPTVQPYVPQEFQKQNRPFLSYTVTGPYTLEALRQFVDDNIVPDLTQVEGVSTLDVSGGRERVLEVDLDEARTLALGLNPSAVQQKIAGLEFVKDAGAVYLDGSLRSLAIRHYADSIAQVRHVTLLADHGRLVRLGDVATVHDTYEEPREYYRIDGNPAVSFIVYREARTNAVDVADHVKQHLAEIMPAAPAGTRLILDDDESAAIRSQLTDLRFRALVSAAVIFVVLLAFLRSFRSAGIVFATIGFSILIALNMIYFGGYTLNVLTLMGLAMGFGLIVDNAIVVLENVYRLRRSGVPPAEAAERGAKEVVLPILAATLTTVIVFIPFVYLHGDLKIYYMPLAIVVGMSLLASLFVAFTFIPALAAKVFGRLGKPPAPAVPGPSAHDARRTTHGARPPLYVRFYGALIGFTLRHPWATAAICLACLGASYHLFDKYVTQGVDWSSWFGQDNYIQVQISFPRGADLDQTDALTQYFEAKLEKMPEIARFVTHVRAQSADIKITFPDSVANTGLPVAIKDQMVSYSHLFGGADVHVYGYGPSFYGGYSPPPNYSIKVLGYNYDEVRNIADALGRRLARFSRIKDVDVNSAGMWYQRDKATEFVLDLDRHKLALHGLSVKDVVGFVTAAVGGRSSKTQFRLNGDEMYVDVTFQGSRELQVYQLEQLIVPSPGGTGVRLGDVATIRQRDVLNRIQREDQQYERYVSYEFRGPTKLGDKVHDAVMKSMVLPEGYKLVGTEDWFLSTQEKQQIYGVLAISLVLIYMVTAALFESIRQPFVVLLTVPMALVGVFLIFFYTGATFTREAYIGVIMMGGIVVNNAILLVDHVNHLRRNEGVPFLDAIVKGTLQRVRPILMTTATTIFGLLPLVLFSASADSNIWNALGFSLIGGLTSSTFFVLTVTPALYMVFERRPERKRLRLAGDAAALEAMNPGGWRLPWRRIGEFAWRGAKAGARAPRWVWSKVRRKKGQ